MPKQTIADQLAEALRNRGWVEEHSRSRKVRTFHPPDGTELARRGLRYFVGKGGSCRVGRTYSASTPIHDSNKRDLLALGDKA